MNYFRITAYYPDENITFIADSFGAFEKLWQFSAYLVSKCCKIIEVATAPNFDFGDFIKAEPNDTQLILRACAKGQPDIKNGVISVNKMSYKING